MDMLMNTPSNVRNVSVIGHTGHGKSVLVNTLRDGAKIVTQLDSSDISTPQTVLGPHGHGPTTRLTPYVTSFATSCRASNESSASAETENTKEHLVHLLDTPGHVDFSSDVTASLRLSDGAVLVVDALQGWTTQCESVLRHAIDENNKAVLYINRFDLALRQPDMSKEDLYQTLLRTVQAANSTTYKAYGSSFPNIKVSPCDGTVVFGAGLHGWAFTLDQFAARYEQKVNIKTEKLRELLWGENFFNPQTNQWSTTSEHEGTHSERGFTRFILDPILKLSSAVENSDQRTLAALLNMLSIQLSADDMAKTGNDLFVAIMQRFLPAKECLSGMIVRQLPSPDAAQTYRTETLYDGPMSDEIALAMKSCDVAAPLTLYVSKIINHESSGRFYALGRVFTGTVRRGQKVSVFVSGDIPMRRTTGKKAATIEQVYLMNGNVVDAMNSIPSGNIVGVTGIADSFHTPVTVTTAPTAPKLKALKPPPMPLIRRTIEVMDAQDLPQLVEALKVLSRTDWSVGQDVNDAGQHYVTAVGERHMEACLKVIQDHASVPVEISDPSTVYRETVLRKSDTVMSKSPNKHVRIYMNAEPLPLKTSLTKHRFEAIKKLGNKEARCILHDDFGWDDNPARIWAFSSQGDDTSLLVDQTTAIQFIHDVKHSIVPGFRWATLQGPLAAEPVISSRFNIMDVVMFCDAIRRGSGQIIPAVRRAIHGSILTAEPTFREPVYSVETLATNDAAPDVLKLFSRRKGYIAEEEHRPGSPFSRFKGYLPVSQSFGFNSELHQISTSRESAQLVFDHWNTIDGGSPIDPTSESGQLAVAIRRRKAMDTVLPTIDLYRDKP